MCPNWRQLQTNVGFQWAPTPPDQALEPPHQPLLRLSVCQVPTVSWDVYRGSTSCILMGLSCPGFHCQPWLPIEEHRDGDKAVMLCYHHCSLSSLVGEGEGRCCNQHQSWALTEHPAPQVLHINTSSSPSPAHFLDFYPDFQPSQRICSQSAGKQGLHVV